MADLLLTSLIFFISAGYTITTNSLHQIIKQSKMIPILIFYSFIKCITFITLSMKSLSNYNHLTGYIYLLCQMLLFYVLSIKLKN